MYVTTELYSILLIVGELQGVTSPLNDQRVKNGGQLLSQELNYFL